MGKYGKAQWIVFLILLCLFALISISCGDDDEETENDDNDAGPVDDDDSTDDDDTDDGIYSDLPMNIVCEYLEIDGTVAPPNPMGNAATPAEYNKIPMFRCRQDTGNLPPRPVKNVLILLAGESAGMNDFVYLAEDMITLMDGKLEVWPVDRRTNLLEDQHGFDVAERERDPNIAWDYYFEGAEVEGKTFAGYLNPYNSETAFLSEWGLDQLMDDLNIVVNKAQGDSDDRLVVIGGHSRGAGVAQMYAAHEFPDGHLGSDDLAGILLIDGGRYSYFEDVPEESYDSIINAIRVGLLPRYENTWGPPEFFNIMAYYAMCATADYTDPNDPEMGPDGHLSDWGLFGEPWDFIMRGRDVEMTNEAYLGLLLDNDTKYIPFFFGHLGTLGGGEVGRDILGIYPSQNNASYHWVRYDESKPEELADLQRILHLTFEGPGDFGDPYYSNRYQMDDWFAGALNAEGTWLEDRLPYFSNRVDCPVYALAGELTFESGFYERYRSELGPVRGSNGASRIESGFHIFAVPEWGHIDVILVAGDRNPFYADFIEWMDKWSDGEVQIPYFEH